MNPTIGGADLLARSRRAWRIALVSYLVPVTVATHWPRLAIGGPEGGIDKLAHFLGFGLLAWIAMHAAPAGRPLVGWLFAAMWVYVDERTQALEMLGRIFSAADMVAGWLGVAIAGALFLVRDPSALTPGAARDEACEREAFATASRGSWVRALALAIATTVVAAGAMLVRPALVDEALTPSAVISAIGLGGLLGVVLATAVGLRLARFDWERARGRRATLPVIPGWSWAIAAPLFVGLAFGYEFAVDAWYGPAPAGEAAVDRRGFVGLGRGFFITAALLAILAADAIAARAGARPAATRVA